MGIGKNGRPDFSKFSNSDLQDAITSIDPKVFQNNYNDCLNEITSRKSQGTWTAELPDFKTYYSSLPSLSTKWLFTIDLPITKNRKWSYELLHWRLVNFVGKIVMGLGFTVFGFLGAFNLLNMPDAPDRGMGLALLGLVSLVGLGLLFVKPFYLMK